MKPSALRIALRSLKNQWRRADVLLLIAAIAVAVAAAAAVGMFTDRIRGAMLQSGGEAIASDLRLNLRAPLSAERQAMANDLTVRIAQVIEFPSVALAGDESSLVSVKAVDSSYPLRGELVVASPAGPTSIETAPERGSVWLERRAMQGLGVAVGDVLELGDSEFVVRRQLLLEPDRSNGFMTLAPRLLMNRADVPATGLLRAGSRASYRALFAGDSGGDILALRSQLERVLATGEELQSPSEAQPALKRSLDRADVFLDLAALVAVILAGIATAMAARLHAQRRVNEVALMKSLGAPQGLLTRLLLWQLALIALAGTGLGLLGGIAAQSALSNAIAALLEQELPSPGLAALIPAVATGIVLLFGFAWPRLAQARRVSPARVFQQAIDEPAGRGAMIASTLTVVGLVLWQARSVKLALIVLIGASVAAALLWLSARALLLLLSLFANRSGAKLTGSGLGIKSLLRRPTENSLLITAFGTGLMALFLLVVVRTDLLQRWQQQTPADAPNRFLVNIGPEQTGDVQQWLSNRGIEVDTLYPMVRARLISINEELVSAGDFEGERGGELLRRELNLSWETAEQNDDELLSGRLWTAEEQSESLVSIEESVATRLNLKLGDTMGFDVAGEVFSATVQSVRKVDWGSMQANFYLLFPPEFLTPYPATYITSLHVPADKHNDLTGLVKAFPNVSVLDLDAILSQLRRIVERVSLAVEVVFVFTLLAGVLVLLAAVQASRAERRREAAVLRVLGGTGGLLRRAAVTEFLVIGCCAALLAAIAAQLIAGLVASRLLELPLSVNLPLWLMAIGIAAGGITLVGVLSLRDVLRQPPGATLKQEM